MREIAIDHPFSPSRGPQRAVGRIDPGDACHHPIGLPQIKARIQSQRHNGRRRLGRPHAGDHSQNALPVHAQVAIALWERVDPVQLVPLYPVLKFARLVSGIGATLEHGNYDNLYGDAGCSLSC